MDVVLSRNEDLVRHRSTPDDTQRGYLPVKRKRRKKLTMSASTIESLCNEESSLSRTRLDLHWQEPRTRCGGRGHHRRFFVAISLESRQSRNVPFSSGSGSARSSHRCRGLCAHPNYNKSQGHHKGAGVVHSGTGYFYDYYCGCCCRSVQQPESY